MQANDSSNAHAILLGRAESGAAVQLLANMANRHGLIAGATGTGKTVTLQVLAEGFSKLGVPVFTADVKGDLSGLAQAGTISKKIQSRIDSITIPEFAPRRFPVQLWDVFAENGLVVRSTTSEMGPVLLSQLMDLNDTQQGVLEVAFRFADEEGLLLIDSKDLRELLHWVSQNLSEIKDEYGYISPASIGAIQRRLLSLEEANALTFFGEPALQLEHLLQHDLSGNGVINILDATRLLHEPRIYCTFLLWLLSELFEELEEVGDQPLPRLVFFFDEAHLLFSSVPKVVLEKLEIMVRLIRSKGVSVFFVTQNPSDIPESILTQLGNRIQHALRAYTPAAQKHIRAAAAAFRENPTLDSESVLTELRVGEALISTLDASGAPQVVERVLLCPPESRIGPISKEERAAQIARSPLRAVYAEEVDRESAFEMLKARRLQLEEALLKETSAKRTVGSSSRRQSAGEAFIKSVLRSVGSSIGRSIARGILGSIRIR